MRQAGILAAGALHALRNHRERLSQDHERARRFATGLASLDGLRIDPSEVETNIVVIGVDAAAAPPRAWVDLLSESGVLTVPFGAAGLRAVMHLDVNDAMVDYALEAFRSASRRLGRRGAAGSQPA